jgi:hypothetical protein
LRKNKGGREGIIIFIKGKNIIKKMGEIIKEIKIIGDKGRRRGSTLVNSGASDSVIRRDIAAKIATLIKWEEPVSLVLGDGETTIKAEYTTVIRFVLKGYTYPPHRFLVLDKLEEDLIIGADAMQRWKIKLDMENEDIIIDERVLRLRLV